jgi:hypothetical protein
MLELKASVLLLWQKGGGRGQKAEGKTLSSDAFDHGDMS